MSKMWDGEPIGDVWVWGGGLDSWGFGIWVVVLWGWRKVWKMRVDEGGVMEM